MYQPLHRPDHRHHSWTGWRGAAALVAVMAVVTAGHAMARAAAPWSPARTACAPAVKTIGGAPARVTLSFNVGRQRHSLVSKRGAKVVLRRGLRSGTFAGKDLLGKPVTGSFTC